MKTSDIRSAFLDYFAEHGHRDLLATDSPAPTILLAQQEDDPGGGEGQQPDAKDAA